jgi:hypothetical protein
MENQDLQFLSNWVHQILDQVDDQLPREAKAALLRGCAQAHYQWANMDEIIAPYRGNLADFLTFLNWAWGWKIDYDPERGIITADENKRECVCPLVRCGAVRDHPCCVPARKVSRRACLEK